MARWKSQTPTAEEQRQPEWEIRHVVTLVNVEPLKVLLRLVSQNADS